VKLEATLFQQIQLNNVCSGFDWVAGVNGLIVMYKVLGLNWEKGPTFSPKERAEIYRMYLDSIISIAA